jgi:hypothetical protein
MGLTVCKNAGYYMLFFLAGLQAIPADLHEAAVLDGAGPWQRLRFVTLPSLRPTLAFVLVIALLNVVTQVDHVRRPGRRPRAGAAGLRSPRWRAETGLVSHLAYVERFPGTWPFVLDPDYPGQA